MKRIIKILFLVLLFFGCEKDKKIEVFSLKGEVKFGTGVCGEGVEGLQRVFSNYTGDIYFVQFGTIESGLTHQEIVDRSIKIVVKDGQLQANLPTNWYSVFMYPDDVYVLMSESAPIIIEEGKVTEKDILFWRCTKWIE